MQDMKTHLEKLRVQVAECEMIRDLATEPAKRELFARLAAHFKALVGELEQAIAAQTPPGGLADHQGEQPSPKDSAQGG
jgi:hypothetical protein